MFRTLTLSLLAAAAPLAAQMPTVPRQPAKSPGEAAARITEQSYRARIWALAHDSMRGRDTPSPELDNAARWIANEFRRFGLAPGGDEGGYIQRYPLQRTEFDVVASRGQVAGVRLMMGKDFLVVPFGPAPRLGTLEGELLFLAYTPPRGETADPLANRDLRGKVIVQYSSRTDAQVRLAAHPSWASRGVAGLVAVTRAGDDVWNVWVERWNVPRLELGTSADRDGMPVIAVRAGSVDRALRAAGLDLDALEAEGRRGPVVRPIVNVGFRFVLAERAVSRMTAPNVVGIVPGSDPALRDEYVVFSAHMDHVGVGRPVAGDSIYNGADDNASGTAAVISLAEAFAALERAPRRSLLFVLVSGEERGLWGSEHFAEHSAVPVDRLVANLNIDMIGRNWRDTIVAIGREHSDLGATLARVNGAHPELGMTAVDDPWPDERFYYRSDHYNFARRGVPVLFFFSGVHPDYHRPSDHPEKIDAEKAVRVTQLLFWLGLEVANADARPKWDPKAYEEVVGR